MGPGRSAAIFPLLATVLFALLALAWAPPASAGPASAAPTQRLAVLELTGTTDRAILSVFSDQIRQGALLAVKPLGYEVMTRENQAALATAMGIDLEACQDGAECEVELGRNIGAALVISGGVTKVGGALIATLKLHTTDKGTLLASSTVEAGDELKMIRKLAPETVALIRQGLGLSGSRRGGLVGGGGRAATARTARRLGRGHGGGLGRGLGTSGRQVVEGLHGIPYARPLTRMRETIQVVRLAEAGENTVTQRSEDGAPTILVQTSEGFSYYMIGNACGEAGCNGVKLSARFSPDETVTPDMVNAINKDVPPVKLWFDETTLAVERYLILDQGLSEDTLLFELSTFAVLVPNVIERFAAAPSE